MDPITLALANQYTADTAAGMGAVQGKPGKDGFSPTVAVSEIAGGHNVTITDASGPHSFDVMDGESGSGTGEDSFVTFKDQTISTPYELQTAIGHRPYYGCIHAINTRILGMAFTNDIVWIAYQLVSGTYYLDLVTADGHCEAWSSASFSVTFSSISSTKFLTEDELDLANGTTFMGYFTTPPEANSTVSMHPDWFIGKKPTIGEQYRGKARNNINKWWDMVVNVVGTFDNEGTTIYSADVVSVTEQSGGTELTAGDGLTIADGVVSVDTPVKSILTQAEYDTLPEAEQNKGMYVISDGGSGGSSGGGSSESLDIYSTEETKIGTWIDGKPLYRKVFIFTNITNDGSNLLDINNLSVDALTNLYGMCYNAKSSFTGSTSIGSYPLNYTNKPPSEPSLQGCRIMYEETTGYLWGGVYGFSTANFRVIIEYTKTTDQSNGS